MSTASSTSRASASCGITSARTKLVTSSRRRPVRASMSTSRTLSAVAITSGSFWKPSRGPTSRTWTKSARPCRIIARLSASLARRDRPRPFRSSVAPGRSGFGLALRLARRGHAGGDRLARRRPRRGGARSCANGSRTRRSRASRTRRRPARGADRAPGVPFRAQSENLTNLKDVLERGPDPRGRHGAARRGGLAAAPRASSACRRAPPPSRRRRWSPDGVTVVSALHTVGAPDARRPRPRARRGRARGGRQEGREAGGGGADPRGSTACARSTAAGSRRRGSSRRSRRCSSASTRATRRTRASASRSLPEPNVVVVLAGGTGGAKLAAGHVRRGSARTSWS